MDILKNRKAQTQMEIIKRKDRIMSEENTETKPKKGNKPSAGYQRLSAQITVKQMEWLATEAELKDKSISAVLRGILGRLMRQKGFTQ